MGARPLSDFRDSIREGFRFRYPPWKTVWEVKAIAERGVVVAVYEDWCGRRVTGAHHHLCSWDQKIEKV